MRLKFIDFRLLTLFTLRIEKEIFLIKSRFTEIK